MSAVTPIEAWPPRRLGGRPGYSARHFEAVAGAQEDPLRVAERIMMRRASDRIAKENDQRVAEGADPIETARSTVRRIEEANEANWGLLCSSFEAVICVLESVPQVSSIKRLVREARRALKKSEAL